MKVQEVQEVQERQVNQSNRVKFIFIMGVLYCVLFALLISFLSFVKGGDFIVRVIGAVLVTGGGLLIPFLIDTTKGKEITIFLGGFVVLGVIFIVSSFFAPVSL